MIKKNWGIAYYHKGLYDQAISDYNKAIELNPNLGEAYYSLACIYSLKNEPNEACAWLKQAVSKGFREWDWIKKDSDMDNIRNADCYKNILEGK